MIIKMLFFESVTNVENLNESRQIKKNEICNMQDN